MAELVNLTIDGVPVSVPKGMLIVDAAKKIGNDIPVFCYHPKLKPVGMCRMCLVEVGTPKIDPATKQPVRDEQGNVVIAFMPKLTTACTTPVSEGMVVRTATEQVRCARGHPGVPAHLAPAGLPDLRQGRRVPVAEPHPGLRPWRQPV